MTTATNEQPLVINTTNNQNPRFTAGIFQPLVDGAAKELKEQYKESTSCNCCDLCCQSTRQSVFRYNYGMNCFGSTYKYNELESYFKGKSLPVPYYKNQSNPMQIGRLYALGWLFVIIDWVFCLYGIICFFVSFIPPKCNSSEIYEGVQSWNKYGSNNSTSCGVYCSTHNDPCTYSEAANSYNSYLHVMQQMTIISIIVGLFVTVMYTLFFVVVINNIRYFKKITIFSSKVSKIVSNKFYKYQRENNNDTTSLEDENNAAKQLIDHNMNEMVSLFGKDIESKKEIDVMFYTNNWKCCNIYCPSFCIIFWFIIYVGLFVMTCFVSIKWNIDADKVSHNYSPN